MVSGGSFEFDFYFNSTNCGTQGCGTLTKTSKSNLFLNGPILGNEQKLKALSLLAKVLKAFSPSNGSKWRQRTLLADIICKRSSLHHTAMMVDAPGAQLTFRHLLYPDSKPSSFLSPTPGAHHSPVLKLSSTSSCYRTQEARKIVGPYIAAQSVWWMHIITVILNPMEMMESNDVALKMHTV